MNYELHPKTWVLAIGVMLGCLLCNFGVAAYLTLHGKPVPDFVSGGLSTFGMGLLGLLTVPRKDGEEQPPTYAAPDDKNDAAPEDTKTQSGSGRD